VGRNIAASSATCEFLCGPPAAHARPPCALLRRRVVGAWAEGRAFLLFAKSLPVSLQLGIAVRPKPRLCSMSVEDDW